MEMISTKNSLNPMLMILASLGYCYIFVTKIPKGFPRLFCLLPLFYFFSILPWFSSSSFLRGIISFFITWIASFKLLLFSFNQGPLFACKTYLDFVLVTVFPLKIKENKTSSCSNRFANYELVQLFNKPYLATSLQDFWGRRWNRLSSDILRQTIYEPTRNLVRGIAGAGPAKMVALIFTLVVSGVMHEAMFYYITCGKKPTWEVAWFFVLHGICMIFEAALKNLGRITGWSPIHPVASIGFTVGFVLVSFYWLLVLPVWRSAQNECGIKIRTKQGREQFHAWKLK